MTVPVTFVQTMFALVSLLHEVVQRTSIFNFSHFTVEADLAKNIQDMPKECVIKFLSKYVSCIVKLVTLALYSCTLDLSILIFWF